MSGDSLPSWRLLNPKAASFKGFLSSSRSAFPHNDHDDNNNVDEDEKHKDNDNDDKDDDDKDRCASDDNNNVDDDGDDDKANYDDKQVRFCQCNPSLAMSVDSV